MDTVSYMLGKRAGGGTMVETDPIFSSSPASGITSNDISNWNGKSDFSGDYDDLTNKPTIPEEMQYSTMPTASVDYLDKIVQFTGTTDSTYTNGYFYKCVSDGQDPATYSWEEVEVQAGGGGASYTAGTNINIDSNNAINCDIPYAVWSVNSFGIGTNIISSNIQRTSLIIGNGAKAEIAGLAIGHSTKAGEDSVNIGGDGTNSNYKECVFVGKSASTYGNQNVGVGYDCNTGSNSVAVGYKASGITKSIAIGSNAKANLSWSIAIGESATTTKNYQMMVGSSTTPINEIAMTTSNGVKVIATEEFVTNYLTTLSTYDATKTQVLKNVNGTLTWVDE